MAVNLDNQRVGIAPSIPHWTTGDGAINIAITNAGPLAHSVKLVPYCPAIKKCTSEPLTKKQKRKITDSTPAITFCTACVSAVNTLL